MRAAERRAGVEADRVRRWLFVVPPNGSGSTYLAGSLRGCRQVIWLPSEGQHVRGFRGPAPRLFGEEFVWARPGCRVPGMLAAGQLYDWPAIRRAWLAAARPASPEADVLVEKSPPNLARVEVLGREFPDCRFLFLVREPFALAESVLRHRPDAAPEDAAGHVLGCLARQRDNVEAHVPARRGLLVRYESMCADPDGTSARVRAWLPELDDVDLRRRVPVKGRYHLAATDLNAEHHARLDTDVAGRLAAAFGPHAALLDWFGYSPDPPAPPTPGGHRAPRRPREPLREPGIRSGRRRGGGHALP